MIFYGTPYSIEKRLGRAYNTFMVLLPQPMDFGCLSDGDTMFTTPDYGHLIQRVVEETPACRLFYAPTASPALGSEMLQFSVMTSVGIASTVDDWLGCTLRRFETYPETRSPARAS